ncbi:MAG: rod shape-determining protein MreC [Candidatus Omnitrophica bacterium]|nr:rod shape-determining protein MreC [Candidatus Omnitrophota bacterium]
MVSLRIEELKKKNLDLRLTLERMKELDEENRRLRRALSIKERRPDLTYARVLGFYPSGFRKVAFIDLGKNDGVVKGTLAIDNQGYLLGKVSQSFNEYSELILLDDPYFSLPVLIENKTAGLLKGTLSGSLKILYVEGDKNITIGDKVWLKYSDLPITVGRVQQVRETKNDFFLDIEVKPESNVYSVNEVFLLK